MKKKQALSPLAAAKTRLGLDVRGKPYFERTHAAGISLGYRRIKDRAGSWTVRVADGKRGNSIQQIGIADDLEAANGKDILSHEDAHDRARKIARNEPESCITVAVALKEYKANTDRHTGNILRLMYHLKPAPRLLETKVSALTVAQLEDWRDGIVAKPVTVNRTIKILKSALTRVADRYSGQITNRNAWLVGLKAKPHTHVANNVILRDEEVRGIVNAAYEQNQPFGLFVEVGAITGARPSQIARLTCRDLKDEDRSTPRLMMPVSDKGRGIKSRSHDPVPISSDLAGKLRQAANGRPLSEPLLLRAKGDAWKTSNDYAEAFARAVECAGLADHPQRVTFYALRHSSIVRRAKLGVSLATIAKIHDTSVLMIERHYARDIGTYDESARHGLLACPARTMDNVVSLARPLT